MFKPLPRSFNPKEIDTDKSFNSDEWLCTEEYKQL